MQRHGQLAAQTGCQFDQLILAPATDEDGRWAEHLAGKLGRGEYFSGVNLEDF
ncbi:hypothetical protein [Paraburkholderia sediminicola]|uniref:hypothetical protein n=1 Tax=Paraburkholderia sediminicola TaxID=458836 RepID=UPI0038BA48AB